MRKAPIDDPVLVRLKDELTKLYGPRLRQVLLYGSRARGDYREDSDYDVLVVLEPPFDFWTEQTRLSRISDAILYETLASGQAVDVAFNAVTPDQVLARTGFMHNVRLEAVEL